MNEFIVFGAGVLAAGVTFAANWLALGPWRRRRGEHWSEQARVLFPVTVAARSGFLLVPSIFVLSVLLLWPDSSPLWFFTGVAALLGTYVGTIPMDREVFPRIPRRELWRQAGIGLLLRFLIWLVFLGAAVGMPNEFGELTIAIGGLAIALWVLWSRGGMIWLGRKLGWFRPPTERLQNIVAAASAKMNIPFREVWLMRSPVAQACAIPGRRQLLFSERLLELLSDDEVAAVCAHELAHLSESKATQYSRSIVLLAYLPWLFFNPMIHTFGFLMFYAMLINTIAVPYFYRKLSRKLESRADRMAQAQEQDAGTYARALTKLYADNLIPAVTAKDRATHPHLYDRILAAGVTPDFPRPTPAQAMAGHGHVFSGLAGILFAIFVLRLIHAFGAHGQ